MCNSVIKALLAAGVLLLSAGSGSAIQLWGGATAGDAGSGTAAQVQDKGGVAEEKPGIDIWIPGLGVVGKMPRVDFGLDLLYGEDAGAGESVPDRSEFEELDSEFAIKGTIKKKF